MRDHGIHHVTAIAADARRNLAFYAGTLGLRLVKRTVNFDDPLTWHLYFGDEQGQPGTILTFFPWAGVRAGRHGSGQAELVSFAIPEGSIGWWTTHLLTHGVRFTGPARRFGQPVLAFDDPDGLHLELVGTAEAAALTGFGSGVVPAEHAIRGVHGVTLWVEDPAPTARVLTEVLGFREARTEGDTLRLESGAPVGGIVDLRRTPGFWQGGMGAGAVHHVAFRAADAAEQEAMAAALRAEGRSVTPPQERMYFQSVYFREPGRVLFEIATDGPGFAVDEPVSSLGEALRLPPWLEPHRDEIAAQLPPLAAPMEVQA